MIISYKSSGNYTEEQHWHKILAQASKVGILEIGVLNGDTSEILCRNAPANTPIIGIDPIIPDSMNAELIGSAEKIRQCTSSFPNYEFYYGYSQDVLPLLLTANRTFDYIFIDGDHVYEAVRKDFDLSHQMLISGGIVAIHDSTLYRGGPIHWPGPSKLADELLNNIIYPNEYEHVASPYCMTILRKK